MTKRFQIEEQIMRVVTFETNPKEYHDGLLKYTCGVNDVPLQVLGIGEENVWT